MLEKLQAIFNSFTKREKLSFQIALAVLFIALIVNGLYIYYTKTSITPKEGGTFIEGLIGQPVVINPILSANNEVDKDLMEILFSDITELAEKYSVSDDHRTWTIELKDGLKWSDGEPLNGDDVVFTIETIQDPETNSPYTITWEGVKVEKINEMEVRFSLKTPYAFFLENLKTLKIIPKHIFEGIPSANLKLSDYNLEPVSSGPYAFNGYDRKKIGFIEEYHLSQNEYYIGEKPFIKNLNIKFFSNKSEAIDAFNHREIDGLGSITSSEAKNVKIGHDLLKLDIPRYYAVFFNGSTAPILKDKAIREALTKSVDIESVISEVFDGEAKKVDSPIYPGIEGYDSNLKPTEYNTEDAKQILDEAGWLENEDGVRTKKLGGEESKLEFELVVPNIDFLIETADRIAKNWESIGIHINLVTLSPSEITGNVIKTRNYDMILFGNILKGNPDIFSFWHSSERFHPGLNLAMYENKTVDSLLESIRKNFDGPSRENDIKKLQTLIRNDFPVVFLYSPTYLYAITKNLGGFDEKLIPSPSNRFDHIEKWYLKTKRVIK
ncbi:MAG: hypothetical protein COU07_03955 [Candidatus Harrisonbacteria bacterium CG10_big_fil_rev_8_21_14_0_10_40_38]|uniref:Solute-binding protein family 5 domain-containing protein n=1 Tax=Candidatus Harrisonbacteria bacterium CG10_big_fil_rev_8_21_14_0_10_40_38 TaxID=1974583 RepID=A0A2H0UTA4_9BACT|nr:MAG: hypothetical protein COU07_03955 [Candidatus Harrisonbacteria bacterium CG10_big_fil_rev_8_21_14_0_10_40_38]